jgi:outer membrane protein TolC
MEANQRAMEAAAVEVDYISDRWQLLPDTDRAAAVQLDQLLQAQERLNAAESAYLHAQLNYSLSQMTYRRATGMLLQAEEIQGDLAASSVHAMEE